MEEEAGKGRGRRLPIASHPYTLNLGILFSRGLWALGFIGFAVLSFFFFCLGGGGGWALGALEPVSTGRCEKRGLVVPRHLPWRDPFAATLA